jgi:hypothetical protein
MARSIRYFFALSAVSMCFAAQASAQPTAEPGARTDSLTVAAPIHDDRAPQTLFRTDDKTKLGGYGAPESKFTTVLSSPALFFGVQGGWIVNHHLILGLAGYGLATRHEVPDAMRVGGMPSTLEMGYGGFRLGYLVAPESLVHFGFGAIVGGGGLVAVAREPLTTVAANGERNTEERRANAEAFLAFEPNLEGEVNVTQFMRVAVSGSVRIVNGIESPGLDMASLSGVSLGLALRFGAF